MTAAPVRIHRDRPAARWLEALPLGNGRIGAMVWGDPRRARFSLNESTLWSGGPRTVDRWLTPADEASRLRAEARELFLAGRVREAQDVLEGLGAAWCQAYQPVGDLVVAIEGDADAPSPAAPRTLDLSLAEHTVSTPGGEHVSWISAADEVLVHAAPLADGERVRLELTSPLVEEQRREAEDGLELVLRAPSDGVPTRHADLAELAWDKEGTSRTAVVVRTRIVGTGRTGPSDAIDSTGAAGAAGAPVGRRVLVVCAIATTWQGLGEEPDRPVADALAQAREQAESALARGEAELRERHRAAPLPAAHDVALELTGSEESRLLTTMFAYGRYLLLASSRPGLPPANLQGLWNDQVLPPWNSNFTVNINLEMNHWAAGVAHVPGAAGALEGYTAMCRVAGRDTARRLYGAGGWTVHHNSDPWGYTDPVHGDGKWATWPMGGLWLERELDSLASFSGEEPREIAARRLPALLQAAEFALDLLHEGPDGTLVTFPSTSPENEWIDDDDRPVALTESSGMDRWLLREVLESLVAKAELLGADDGEHEHEHEHEDPIVGRARAALERIPGPRVGADGRILEWHRDGVGEVEPTHRHVSHLGFEYPGGQHLAPELSAAAASSMVARGDEATGWSLAWKTALWARLHRPDKVQALLELFLRPAELPDGSERSGLYPNLFSAHPPFQIDGNIGIVAAIAEALVQSHRGEIELLPALPAIMASGSVRGLRARPGIEIAMTWADGRITALTLRAVGPGALGEHRVRVGGWSDVGAGDATNADGVRIALTDLEPVEVDPALLG